MYCSDTGCYQSKVGECYLFSVKLDFEKAREYRKSYGAYLRRQSKFFISVLLCAYFGTTIYFIMISGDISSLLLIFGYSLMISFQNPIEMGKAVGQNKFGRHALRLPIGFVLCCSSPMIAYYYYPIPQIPIGIRCLLAIPLAIGCVFFLVQAIKSFVAGVTKLVNRIKK